MDAARHSPDGGTVMIAWSGFTARTYRRFVSRLLFYVLVLVILLYLIFPFYWAFRSAITPDKDLFATPVQYFPTNPTWSNFAQVLGDANFLRAMVNSAIVALAVTILALLIGASGAYALGRFRFRGRVPVMYVVLSMTMFPQVAVLGALWNMINQLGLYDHLSALILTYLLFTVPFTVWVLTYFFKALPAELEDAAYVDGASPFETFWRIMVPLVAPGFATTGLLAFIAAWNEFLFAVSFVQSPESRTVPVAMFYFEPTANVGDFLIMPWGQEMAATVLVTIPLVVLTLVFHRRIVAGLTGSVVKR
ncbi:MAG: carbohydrate ABC transporter permease [Chloroflexota bacterium]